MRSCQSYICDVKSESVVLIVTILEHIVQLYPIHMSTLILPILSLILTSLLEGKVGVDLPVKTTEVS